MIEITKEHAARIATERGVKCTAEDILRAYCPEDGNVTIVMHGKVSNLHVTIEFTKRKDKQ